MNRKAIDKINTEIFNNLFSGDPESLVRSESALSQSVAMSYKKGEAFALINLGWLKILNGDFIDAVNECTLAVEIFKEIKNEQGLTRAYNAQAAAYVYLGKYNQAFDSFQESLKYSRKNGEINRQAVTMGNISEVYNLLGLSDKALETITEAVEDLGEGIELDALINLYINKAVALQHKKEYDEAIETLVNLLDLCQKCQDKVQMAKAYNLLGAVYQDIQIFDKAEELHLKSLTISRELGNKIGELEVLQNLGHLFVVLDDKKLALVYYEEANKISEILKADDIRCETNFALAKIHASFFDYKNAYRCLVEAGRLEKTIRNKELDKALAQLQIDTMHRHAQKEAKLYKSHNIQLKKKSMEVELAYYRLMTVSKIGLEITSSLDLQDIFLKILENIREIMDASIFGIVLVDEENAVLKYQYFVSELEESVEFEKKIGDKSGFVPWVLENRKEIVLQDVDAEYSGYIDKLNHLSKTKRQSAIFLPVFFEEKIVAILTVQSFEKEAYSNNHLYTLQALGAYIAIALENSKNHNQVNALKDTIIEEKRELERAYSRISHMANHDNLTGLPNRRLLYELLHQEMPLMKRSNKKLALLYIDLDNFKPINDNYGHDVGDKVLIILTQNLKSVLRESDTIARLGGDEFIIVLCNIQNKNELIGVMEKLYTVFNKKLEIDSVKHTVSASIGISMYPDDGETIDELLKKADLAMYEIKQSQKNSYKFV